MEAREEKSAFVRSYAVNQYEKDFLASHKKEDGDKNIRENLKIVEEVYRYVLLHLEVIIKN